jgi:hypothetical protein
MKQFFALILIAFMATNSFGQKSKWTPKADFQLESSNLQQTMLLISGMSYGLTEYSQQLTILGRQQLFCLPGNGLVTSQMVFEILNAQYVGKNITSEQAVSSVVAGLQKRFPCH